jgi:hypothetical protein
MFDRKHVRSDFKNMLPDNSTDNLLHIKLNIPFSLEFLAFSFEALAFFFSATCLLLSFEESGFVGSGELSFASLLTETFLIFLTLRFFQLHLDFAFRFLLVELVAKQFLLTFKERPSSSSAVRLWCLGRVRRFDECFCGWLEGWYYRHCDRP